MDRRLFGKLWAEIRQGWPKFSLRSDGPQALPLRLCELEDRVLFSAAPLPLGSDLLPAVDADGAEGSPGADWLHLPDGAFVEPYLPAQDSPADALDDDSVSDGLEPGDGDSDSNTVPIDDVAQLPADPPSFESGATAHSLELVIVDTGTRYYQQLGDDLVAHADESRQFEILLLDSSRDGIEQISEALRGRTGIGALHLVSHGADGRVQLGNTWLDINNVDTRAGEFVAWNDALRDGGDVLIYGCDVAANAEGQALLERISALCDCDVAASIDDTGHARYGGDWDLEYATGAIETDVAFSTELQEHWDGKLAVITVTTTADVVSPGDGLTSLREAILQVNSGLGGDTIILGPGTYLLTLGPSGDNSGNNGDLDILNSVTITGSGAFTTIVDGNGLDRVFHIRNNSTVVTMSGLTIQGGLVSDDGAGVYVDNSSTLKLSDAIVTGNTATGKQGGGIYVKGSLNLDRVVIANNTADEGGGLYFQSPVGAALTNVTISGNTAASKGGGFWTDKPITIVNSTIAFNTSPDGGGVFDKDGLKVTLKNTILYNPGSANSNKALLSAGNNIDSDGTAGLGDPLDGVNPQLGSLANNGGSTLTHALSVLSPAINAGSDAGAPPIDQRGYLRVGTTDVGAFEYVITLNTPPTITSNGAASTAAVDIAENSTAVTTVTATDPDILQTLTYSILGGADAAKFTINGASGVLRFVSAPDFESPTDAGGNNVYDVTVRVSDGNGGADTQDIAVTVAPVNEAPAFAGLDAMPVFTEGGAAVVLDGNATIADPELSAADNYSGATLKLARSGGANAEDLFGGSGTLSPLVPSGSLIVGSITVGTVTTNSGGTLLLTFNANATAALVNSVLQQITYANSSFAPPANVQIDFTIDDANSGNQGSGGALSGSGSVTGTINAVNNAPALDLDGDDSSGAAGSGYAVTFTEGDGPTAIADADTDVMDVDGSTFDHVTLTISGLLDGNSERLLLDGDTFALATGVAGQNTAGGSYRVAVTASGGAATVTITRQGGGTFTTAEAETLIQSVRYQHADGDNPTDGNRRIDVTVNDGTDDSAAATTIINVNPVNDPPVLGNNQLTISEGQTVTLGTGHLSGTDVESSAATLTFTVSGVTAGRFERTSAPGVAITSFLQSEVTAGEIVFVHNGGELAPAYSVRVSDGTDNTAPAAATIMFTNLNDPPVLGNNQLTLNEGQTLTLSATNLNAADVETGSGALTFTVSGVTAGQFERSSAPGVAITSFLQSEVTAGEIVFIHNGSELAPAYNVRVSDGTETTAPAPATITFTKENDSPVLGSNQLTLTEGQTVRIGAGNLSAADVETAPGALMFTVSGVTAGQFERTGAPGLAITSFQQSEVTDGTIVFVHDGSDTAPAYDVSVSDGSVATAPAPASIRFVTAVPVPGVVPTAPPRVDPAPGDAADSTPDDRVDDEPVKPVSPGQTPPAASENQPDSRSGDSSDGTEKPASAVSPAGMVTTDFVSVRALPVDEVVDFGDRSAQSRDEAARRNSSRLSELVSVTVAQPGLESFPFLLPSSALWDDLRGVEQDMQRTIWFDHAVMGSAFAVSGGLTVGYVAWMLRGGILLSSLLSQLPAWRFIDPLVVLQSLSDDEEEDGDSLQSILEESDRPDSGPSPHSAEEIE